MRTKLRAPASVLHINENEMGMQLDYSLIVLGARRGRRGRSGAAVRGGRQVPPHVRFDLRVCNTEHRHTALGITKVVITLQFLHGKIRRHEQCVHLILSGAHCKVDRLHCTDARYLETSDIKPHYGQ